MFPLLKTDSTDLVVKHGDVAGLILELVAVNVNIIGRLRHQEDHLRRAAEVVKTIGGVGLQNWFQIHHVKTGHQIEWQPYTVVWTRNGLHRCLCGRSHRSYGSHVWGRGRGGVCFADEAGEETHCGCGWGVKRGENVKSC